MSFFEEIKQGVPLGGGRVVPWETPVAEIDSTGALEEAYHLAWLGHSILDNEATIRVLAKRPTQTVGWFMVTFELEAQPTRSDYERFRDMLAERFGVGEEVGTLAEPRCRWVVDGDVEVEISIYASSERLGSDTDLILWVKKLIV